MEQLGHRIIGSGSQKVLLLHNWFCDSSSYEPLLPYLDQTKATYLLVDLRGYGRSKSWQGEYSVQEACQDAMALVQMLAWDRFHIVGHSMSGMIAQKMAVEHPARIQSIVAITPVPACGAPAPAELMSFLEKAALDADENAMECAHLLTGRRLTSWVINQMVRQWRACSTDAARLGYLRMFSYTDFSKDVQGLFTPMLVIYGEFDTAHAEAPSTIGQTFLKWYPNAQMICCSGAGHFPTQETPMYLASRIEEFILRH